jgi:hypothetical protein
VAWRSITAPRAVEEDALGGDHADPRHVLAANHAQDGEDLPLPHQSRTAPFQPGGRAFEDLMARLVQERGREQATQRAPDDGDTHGSGPPV